MSKIRDEIRQYVLLSKSHIKRELHGAVLTIHCIFAFTFFFLPIYVKLALRLLLLSEFNVCYSSNCKKCQNFLSATNEEHRVRIIVHVLPLLFIWRIGAAVATRFTPSTQASAISEPILSNKSLVYRHFGYSSVSRT